MNSFVLILFLVFGLNEVANLQTNSKKKYVTMMFLIFGFLMMFRSVYVGNDTYAYTKIFENIISNGKLKFALDTVNYEKGFVFLSYMLGKISENPQILFIVTGAFTAFSFGRFIYKYSDMPWLSILMFLTLQFYDLTLSGVRQVVSVSILLFAYDFLLDRKFWRFAFLCWLSSLFHVSGILFIILYPLTSKKRESLFYAGSIIISGIFFVGFEGVIKIVDAIFPRYLKYLMQDGRSYSATFRWATFLTVLMWFIMFLIAKLCEKKYILKEGECLTEEQEREMQVNSVHEISVWLGIIMLLMSFHGTILNRFKYIYATPLLVYYPNMILNIP